MTRQVTDQLYIEIGYHTPEQYYVYTAEAQSQQAASSTLSCDAGKITQAQADMVITTVFTATISHIEGADLFAFSDNQLAAQVDRIRDNNISTSTVFAVSTEVSRIRSLVADQFAISDITVINERSRAFQLETQAAFSLVAETSSIELASADLVSITTLTSLESVTKGFIAQLDLTSAAVIDVARTRESNSNQSATTETSVLGTATRNAVATLDNTTELQCVISHIEGADLSAFGTSQMSITARKNAIGIINSALTSISTISAGRIRQFSDYQGSPNRVAKTITRTGSTVLSTIRKFGTHSAFFDGAGDRLDIASDADFNFGTDAWTIEFWVRHTDTSGDNTLTIIDMRTSGSQQVVHLEIVNNLLRFRVTGSTRISSNTNINANTWYHIAISRNSSGLHSMFVDGILQTQTWTNTSSYVQAPLRIGENYNGTNDYQGYIDDIRIIKGNALYTSNFTAPTSALSDVSGTVLLMPMDVVTNTTSFFDIPGTVFAYVPINYQGTTILTANNVRLRYGQSTQQSITIQNSIAVKQTDSIVNLICTSVQTTNAEKLKIVSADLINQSVLNCTISHIEGADLSAFGQSVLIANANSIVRPSSLLQTTSSLISNVSALKRFNSTIQLSSNFLISRYAGNFRPIDLNLTTGTYNASIKKFGTHSLIGAIGSGAVLVERAVTPTQTSDFYIEGWVYNTVSGLGGRILEISNFLDVRLSFGRLRLLTYIESPGNPGSSQIYWDYTHSTALSLNTWHHWAFMKSNNRISFYQNGTRIFTFQDEVNPYTPYLPWGATGNSTSYVTAGQYTEIYVDEIYGSVISALGYNANNSTITVPTSARTNDPTTTAFLYHFDNSNKDDISVTEIASASLLQTNTLTATISGPQRTSATLQIISTATIQAQKAAEIILSAFGQSQTITNGLRVRYADAALAATTNISALNQTIKSTNASLALDFQQSAAVNVIASAQASISGTTVSLTATARTRRGDIQANVESQMVTDAVITASAQAQIESTSAISIPGERIRYADSSQNTETVIAADLGLIKRFASDLQSQIVQITDAVKNVSAVADIQGITISVTALGAIRQGLIPMSIESELAADGVITANGVVNVQSTTNAVINGIIKVEFDANLAATTQVQADNLRVRYIDAALAIETAQTANINYTAFGQSQQASTTTISATASGTIDFAVVIQATTSAVISANRFRDNIVTAVADSAVVANNVRTRDNSIANASDVVLTAESARTRPFDAQLVANTIDLFVAVKTGQALADMAVNSQVQATVNIIAYGLVPLATEVQSSITAVKRSNVNLNVIAQVVIVAEGTTNILGEADVFIDTNLSASATVIYSGAMAAATDTDLTATGVARRGFAFLDQSSGTMTVSASRIRGFSSNFASISIDLIIGQRVVSFNVAMTATSTLTAQGRDIDLAKYVYIIPNEIRTWTIAEENRTRVIKEETRIYKIRRY